MNIQEANNNLIQIHIYTLILGHFKKSASILTDQETPKWSAMTDDQPLLATLPLHLRI